MTTAPPITRNQICAAVASGADRVDDRQQPEDRRQPVHAPPAGSADAVTEVVGEAEHGEAVAGDDPDPGPDRPVGADEGDRDTGRGPG